ncbi:type II toxin-antitoxin system HigB family toxin [Candidatus Venteria ishoeyi]|uniref:type II toxin-antitoxin system HigB family toxin n=1 Tax=Candidatus Venteria ishoeyi TaxID=1899563 RepID=UPI00387EBA63
MPDVSHFQVRHLMLHTTKEIHNIAAIHYNSKKVFVRHILTHSEYDRGKWKQECQRIRH